jgi:hypothetical protein
MLLQDRRLEHVEGFVDSILVIYSMSGVERRQVKAFIC